MILSYGDPGYVCIVGYTDDKEFYIATTNTAELDGWETCVFSNDPETNHREFESLLEMVYSETEEMARLTHKNLLRKWNVLGTKQDVIWLGPVNAEEYLGIGEGNY